MAAKPHYNSNARPQRPNPAGAPAPAPTLTAIDAPYNFVPLADWVHCPEWAERVSHDLPFADGVSGHLDLKITAHTPLLVGGLQKPASEYEPGGVTPFRLPDGRYAIPGTSLKGMIRAVIEIASFSRMSMVDDMRYGLRDISGKYVSVAYTLRVRNRIQTGLMRLGNDGLPVITPCSMVRLSHHALEEWLGIPAPIFRPDRSVAKKYQAWQEICAKKGIPTNRIQFKPIDGEAAELGKGQYQGIPVFTGQISDSTQKGGKRRDFVFYAERPNDAFTLSSTEWVDFLFIHGDQATKDAENMAWPGYWKKRYWDKKAVPVFYIRDQGKTRVGLAYMPRLAGDFSTHEMIEHTSSEHLQGQGRGCWDFAETLFGTVGERPERCLKGRVHCAHAISENAQSMGSAEPTILNGPKPSYFPNYIRQQASNGRLTSQGYATYLATREHPQPELRGWKRYPARPMEMVGVQPLTDEQRDNRRVQIVLEPLKEKAIFKTRVRFHNLKPEELGALIWAIEWGGNDQLRHSLGMGKPFGFGQISLEIIGHHIRPNRLDEQPLSLKDYRERFVEYMKKIGAAHRYYWEQSRQICALLGMSNPANAAKFKGKLKHMHLEPKKRINEFVQAKQNALVLDEYPPQCLSGGVSTVASSSSTAQGASQTPIEWTGVEIQLNPSNGELLVNHQGKTATVRNPEAQALRDRLPDELKQRLKNKRVLKNCRIRVEPLGNAWKITAILAVGDIKIEDR